MLFIEMGLGIFIAALGIGIAYMIIETFKNKNKEE